MVGPATTTRVTAILPVTFLLKSKMNPSSYWLAALLIVAYYLCANLVLTQSSLHNLSNESNAPRSLSTLNSKPLGQNLNNQRSSDPPKRNIDSFSSEPISTVNIGRRSSSHNSSNSRLTERQSRPLTGSISLTNFTAQSDPDVFNEGSGAGPIPIVKHKSEKLDDTEDGDDDDDEDEDYDYKESLDVGSGNGKLSHDVNKKSDMVIQGSRPLNKPNRDEGDIYFPYRPPTTVANNISLVQPTTQPTAFTDSFMTTQSNTRLPTLEIPKANLSTQVMDTVPSKSNSSPILTFDQPVTESVLNKPTIFATSKNITSFKNNHTLSVTTEMPKLMLTSTTTKPSFSAPVTSPSSIGSRFHSPTPGSKPSSSSSGSRYNTTLKISENDYDYEEENDDDDSEDTSNFEDNETIDSTSTNKTTNQPTVSPSRHTQSNVGPSLNTEEYGGVTSGIRLPAVPSMPVKPVVLASTTSNPPIIIPSTRIPSINRDTFTTSSTTSSPIEGDSEDDETMEEDEEYDENESDMGEEDEEEDEDNPDLLPSSTSNPSRGSTQSNRWTTPKPTLNPYFNTDNERYKPSRIPTWPTSGSNPTQESYDSQFKNLPPVTMAPSTTTTTTRTTSTTTLRPVINKTTNLAAVTTPSSNLYWRPSAASTTMKPATTPTVPMRQPTGPRSRVTPLDVLAFDKNLQDDEANLTRQIYDKAVEVYKATSKAVTSAVNAIWPPSFDLNASTFEPLLAQPFLFMFALGAAVVGLVLTMMLVVYIVTYQIQPKDDISLYG